MIQEIYSKEAPEAIGPYSQAIKSGNFLFISGQIPLDPGTGDLVGMSIEQQAQQVLDNLGAILKEAGLDFADVVKTEVFLKDFDHFASFNDIYESYFSQKPFPARWAIQAARLPRDVLVEVGCVAAFRT